MSLVKRDELGFPTISKFFDDFFGDDFAKWPMRNLYSGSMPAANIMEKDDAFEVELAAPGMDKKDFKVELNNNVLTISSEKKFENEEKDGDKYTRREFSYQSFRRSFTLPDNSVDHEKIEAKYKDGVLRLHLPKKEEAKVKPVRTINIQ